MAESQGGKDGQKAQQNTYDKLRAVDTYDKLAKSPETYTGVNEVVETNDGEVKQGKDDMRKPENTPTEEKYLIFDELNASQSKPGKPNKTEPINREDLLKIKHLGGGHFGLTFKAHWKTDVVVIKASKEGTSTDDFEELRTFLKLPTFPNVLSIIGVCQSFAHGSIIEPTLALIIPFQANGDLKKFARKRGRMNEDEYTNIVLGMAKGLAHLHENNVIHRDLALRNYLVSLQCRILIADFGLSRGLDGTDHDNPYYRLSGAEVPWRTIPMEVLKEKKFTKQSDIWAFGIAVWELFHPKMVPFPEIEHHMDLCELLRNSKFCFSLDYADKKEVTYPEILETVVQWCCEMDPSNRPAISEVIDLLTEKYSKQISTVSREMRIVIRQKNVLQSELNWNISEGSFLQAHETRDKLEEHAKKMKEVFQREIIPDPDEIREAKIKKYELEQTLDELLNLKKEQLLKAQEIVDSLEEHEKKMEELFGIQSTNTKWKEIDSILNEAEKHDPPLLESDCFKVLHQICDEKDDVLMEIYESVVTIKDSEELLVKFTKKCSEIPRVKEVLVVLEESKIVDEEDIDESVRQIGDWIVGQILGTGGFSVVYLGTHKQTFQRVALKVYSTTNWKRKNSVEFNFPRVEHKNVIKVSDVDSHAKLYLNGKKKDVMLVVMELAGAGEFFDFLSHTGCFDETIARSYFQQLIEGLEACHAKCIAHRDVKPENLLLDANFRLKIGGFGFAKVLAGEDDTMSTEVGTRGYMAPEILKHNRYSTKTDIFSAGVVLFIMLAGFPPFQIATRQDWWFHKLLTNRHALFWEAHTRAAYFSDGAKDIINKVFDPNPDTRLSIDQIKEHEWYNGKTISGEAMFAELSRRKRKVDAQRAAEMRRREGEHEVTAGGGVHR